jgi:Flp pilus assembly protein TadG
MNLRKKIRSRRGSAALMAITAAIPLIGVAGTLLMVTVRQRNQVEASAVVAAARDAAASGVQDAMAKLAVDPNWAGEYDLAVGGSLAHVVVTDWTSDGVDNDNNGKVDDLAETDYVSITSEGRVNVAYDRQGRELSTAALSQTKDAGSVVKKTKLDIAVNSAFYCDDPLATFTVNGNAFKISGEDTNIDGTPGPNPDVAGIGTTGDPALIEMQLSAEQQDNIVGMGLPPSIATVATEDIMEYAKALGSLATLTWSDADAKEPSAKIGDREKLIAQIAHAKGNLELSGSSKGCGVLVVDGNLEVTGNLDFVGLIFVTGSVTFRGGGDKVIRGALFTPGNVNGEDIEVSGSIDIGYSSEAIATVEKQLSVGVELISWTQR